MGKDCRGKRWEVSSGTSNRKLPRQRLSARQVFGHTFLGVALAMRSLVSPIRGFGPLQCGVVTAWGSVTIPGLFRSFPETTTARRKRGRVEPVGRTDSSSRPARHTSIALSYSLTDDESHNSSFSQGILSLRNQTTAKPTDHSRSSPNATRSKADQASRVVRLPGVQRVHCISDLHVDHSENLRWLESKCCQAAAPEAASRWNASDLIVVAGDISHRTERIRRSLELLLGTGARVVFVPGNHEAWLTASQAQAFAASSSLPQHYSSVSKLEEIEDLCHELGVYTTGDCVCVGGKARSSGEGTAKAEVTAEELWILPLDSWYDGSLSMVDLEGSSDGEKPEPPHYDLVRDFPKWPWVDFVRSQWPAEFFRPPSETSDSSSTKPLPLLQKIPTGLIDYYLERNQAVMDAFRNATNESSVSLLSQPRKKVSLMTVTHFLPNHQSLPDWKDLGATQFCHDSWLDHGAGGTSAKFSLVAGSAKIDEQIRSLGHGAVSLHRRLHVFGHSHRPKDFVYEGIRYVHNPLGSPRERSMHMVDPGVDIKLVWKAGEDDHQPPTILRYWEEHGGGLEMLVRRVEARKRRRRKRRESRRRRFDRSQDSSRGVRPER